MEKDEGTFQSSGGSGMSPQSEKVILELLVEEMENRTRKMQDLIQDNVLSDGEPHSEKWGAQLRDVARIHAALAEFRREIKKEERPQ